MLPFPYISTSSPGHQATQVERPRQLVVELDLQGCLPLHSPVLQEDKFPTYRLLSCARAPGPKPQTIGGILGPGVSWGNLGPGRQFGRKQRDQLLVGFLDGFWWWKVLFCFWYWLWLDKNAWCLFFFGKSNRHLAPSCNDLSCGIKVGKIAQNLWFECKPVVLTENIWNSCNILTSTNAVTKRLLRLHKKRGEFNGQSANQGLRGIASQRPSSFVGGIKFPREPTHNFHNLHMSSFFLAKKKNHMNQKI